MMTSGVLQKVPTKNLVLTAMFAVLIIIGTFLRVPVPVVPFTLQFLFTNLAGLILGKKWGAISVGVYLALGLVAQLPVFAGGGGIGYIFQPSFGYLLGFLAGAFLAGFIREKSAKPKFTTYLWASLANLAVVYALGMLYYYLIKNLYIQGDGIGVWALFFYCFVLAVPGDILLSFLSAFVCVRLFKIFKSGVIEVPKKIDLKNDLPQNNGSEQGVETLKQKVLSGGRLSREEANLLVKADISELTQAANEIRAHFHGDNFDLCSIVNGKSGQCSEDCHFCAQSSHYKSNTAVYSAMPQSEIVAEASRNFVKGVKRFSIVTSGKRLTDGELAAVCKDDRAIARTCGISLCASHGLLGYEQLVALKQAGVTRYHNNLETSRNYFPKICSTHTYDDKLTALADAARAGLELCSGGIMGLGETFDDRIDLAFELLEAGVKSVPINLLSPIAGTPLACAVPLMPDEPERIVAIFRFILPDAVLRLAGGRGNLADKGRAAFMAGANGAITGDMLTTSGISIDDDKRMLTELHFKY